jgi:uncharacterized Ntn-hydrolase superfamily protein
LSILAFDPEADVVGAAVTSCVLAAGRRVLHVRHGVGAAVVQASSEITWGTDILDRLAGGADGAAAIAPCRRDDSQVAVMSFDGLAASHTGRLCTPNVGEVQRPGVSIQVNTAAEPDAADRMMAAFDHTVRPLAERMVAALAASGGDARGRQSAGVIVSGAGPLRGYEDEPHVDLRVDDHRDPVGELSRLLGLHRAHGAMRALMRRPVEERIDELRMLAAAYPDDPHLRRAADA